MALLVPLSTYVQVCQVERQASKLPKHSKLCLDFQFYLKVKIYWKQPLCLTGVLSVEQETSHNKVLQKF